MALRDNKSERPKDADNLTTPFSIAARSTTSKPVKYIRDLATQTSPVQSKSSQKRLVSEVPIQGASIKQPLSYNTVPSSVTKRVEAANVMDEEEDSSRDFTPNDSSLQNPGPGSSVSQQSRTPSKRSRAKTSYIHQHISTRGDNYICNKCSRIYKSSGGTGAIARHLKKAHSIDPTASGTAEKRKRERTAIDTAILRGAAINIKAEEKRREELMGIGLDKNTLEYLYLRWTLASDIPLKHVRDTAFRTFLEYINPVANRMLPNSESTMKIHAESLLADGKQGLKDDAPDALSRPAG